MGVEYRRWRSKEASAAAAALLEYQQDHSVEVPVDTKKLPRQSVGWVLQEGTADDHIQYQQHTEFNIPMALSLSADGFDSTINRLYTSGYL